VSAEKDELAYALITPYSLHKSRTGGIIARLLWANVKLVAARMYAPRPDGHFIRDYCDVMYDPAERTIPLKYQKMLIEYVVDSFNRPNVRNISNRMMVLVFRGPGAVGEIAEAVGHICQDVRGDNVRGTFGDFISDDRPRVIEGEVSRQRNELLKRYAALQRLELPAWRNSFFEPAVLTGQTPEMTKAHLEILRKYAYSDGGFVLDALEEVDSSNTQTSMVVLKPESFLHKNPLPGNLVDFFARTGMFITGAKVLNLSVEEASRFYGLKIPQFAEQLKGMVEDRARQIVERARALARTAVERFGADPDQAFDPQRIIEAVREMELLYCPSAERGPGEVKDRVCERLFRVLPQRLENLEPEDSVYAEIADELKEVNARAEFDELIKYMTGQDPAAPEQEQDSETLCLALLYSGPDALQTIRRRLKELRTVYGRNVLQNRAHASDPDEDPLKEMEVLGMPSAPAGESRPCDLEKVVSEFYGSP